jgi:hypothetical protein
MSKRLMVGTLTVGLGIALATACSSSENNGGGSSGGSGGSATGGTGAGGSGGSATGGSGGGTDGGQIDGSGGTTPYADANLDAPYQLPDGGCGQIFCPPAVAAGCKNGFQSLNDCASFCTQVAQSTCNSDWEALLTCAGANPDIQCDSTGQISITGCDSQAQKFGTCFSALSDGGS